jgi:hypothetical protein
MRPTRLAIFARENEFQGHNQGRNDCGLAGAIATGSAFSASLGLSRSLLIWVRSASRAA